MPFACGKVLTLPYNPLRASSTHFTSSLHFTALSIVPSCHLYVVAIEFGLCMCTKKKRNIFNTWKFKSTLPRTGHSSLIWGGLFKQRQTFLKPHIFEMLFNIYKELYIMKQKQKKKKKISHGYNVILCTHLDSCHRFTLWMLKNWIWCMLRVFSNLRTLRSVSEKVQFQ